jgi:hypothetical protein
MTGKAQQVRDLLVGTTRMEMSTRVGIPEKSWAHVCRRNIQGFQRYPHAFSERVILHRLAGGRRQKEPFALTRQLRSCAAILPQDVERERFEGNSASDPRTALLH